MMLVKRLLILDAVGAVVSVVMLGVVLVKFYDIFGIPISVLHILASIPVGFFIFDLLAIFSKEKIQPGRLMTIGILNILYCLLSFVMAIVHASSLTIYGWAYIIVEIIIVVALSAFELKTGRNFLSYT